MRQVFDGKQMQQMDGWAIHQLGIPGRILMERAAEALCRRVMEESPARVIVLCGTGNNGGDGFAAARLLWERGVKVRVFIIGKQEKLSGAGDAAHNLRRLAEFPIPVVWGVPEKEEADCIVDALSRYPLRGTRGHGTGVGMRGAGCSYGYVQPHEVGIVPVSGKKAGRPCGCGGYRHTESESDRGRSILVDVR